MAETGNELRAPKNLWLLHWLVSLSQVSQNLMGGLYKDEDLKESWHDFVIENDNFLNW